MPRSVYYLPSCPFSALRVCSAECHTSSFTFYLRPPVCGVECGNGGIPSDISFHRHPMRRRAGEFNVCFLAPLCRFMCSEINIGNLLPVHNECPLRGSWTNGRGFGGGYGAYVHSSQRGHVFEEGEACVVIEASLVAIDILTQERAWLKVELNCFVGR